MQGSVARVVALLFFLSSSFACGSPPQAAAPRPPTAPAKPPPPAPPAEATVTVAVGRSAPVAPKDCDVVGWDLEDRRFFDVDAARGLELRGVVGLREGKGSLRVLCRGGRVRVVPIAVSAGVACTAHPLRRGEDEALPVPKNLADYFVLGSAARVSLMPSLSLGMSVKAERSGSTLVTTVDAAGAQRCTRIETDVDAPPPVLPLAPPPPSALAPVSISVGERAPLVAGCDVVGWESEDAAMVDFESNAPLAIRTVFGVRAGTTNVTVHCRGGGKRVAAVTVAPGPTCEAVALRRGELWSGDATGVREFSALGPSADVVPTPDGKRMLVSARRAGAAFLVVWDSQHTRRCTRFDVAAERARCPSTVSLHPDETRTFDASNVASYHVAGDASAVGFTNDKKTLVAKGRRAGHAIVWMLDKADHETCWGLDVEP